MAEEDAQQRITFLLQEVDANINAAHRSATQICATMRRHHQILKQIHDATQVWRPLFESFRAQPVTRRTVATPARSTYESLTPPVSGSDSGKERACNTLVDGNNSEEESMDSNLSIVAHEQSFKTTTLRHHFEESVHEETMNVTMTSDRLPAMARTSYLPTPAAGRAPDVASSIRSEDRSNWSPSMSSPPRTGMIKSGGQRGGNLPRHAPTPSSAISSVPPSSPLVSKNLMEVGAFEYTPPRKSASERSSTQQQDERATHKETPSTPEIPAFATVQSATVSAPSGTRVTIPKSPSSVSKRKRQRMSLSSPGSSTRPSSPSERPVPSFSSPSLRRKYSTAGKPPPAPTPSQPLLSRATYASKSSTPAVLQSDEPMTPPLDLTSPLLRTQLRAMTPHTPLSNRLVGANFDIGSAEQESKLSAYDESFTSGGPAPEFELSLFPLAFQRGVGAVQISTLYSKFQGYDESKPAIGAAELAEMLPDYSEEKIALLLELLVSRHLLRPFVVEGNMYWQIPM